ncbi:MAG: aminotransferase class V-fold PLP-dependent enzyme [Nitrospiraceae bacterium]|nr:aminotransferase class V-fold PLP-dependent enzyme [Nitrospiraceae bacterium]
MSPSSFVDLDSSATTPVSDRVMAAMLPWFREIYANPGSPNPEGERAKAAVIKARESLAEFLGAETREILFTSGGTESNQAAVRSALRARPERRTLLLSAVEHSSILGLIPDLEREGFKVSVIPAGKDGRIDPGEVSALADNNTALVAVMYVNNETGAINPVEEIGEIAHRAGAFFLCDGVAAVGKIPVDAKTVPADFLSLSGHKIHGPKGTGALFVRKGEAFHPLMPGSQERKRRGGTENVPGIVGLGEAARESREFLLEGPGRLERLRDLLEEGVFSLYPEARRNGPENSSLRAPHMANLCFPGMPAEKILLALVREGIYASMGSACSTGALDPSHVLLSMGLSREAALSSLRFSLPRWTSSGDIDRTLSSLGRILGQGASRRVS